jgi:hypothetical protein
MEIRRTLAVIFGITQSVIAVLTVLFAFILYFNFFDIRTLLNVAVESPDLHALALFFFGFFSLVSGLFLIYEWAESR